MQPRLCRRPRPRRAAARQLSGHPFIGGGSPGVWQIYRAWLEANGLTDAVAMQHDSSTGMLSAVRAGFGLAVLPCMVADFDPELVQCLPPDPGNERGLWLLTHERLRHTPRIRAVLDFLYERLTRLRAASRRGSGRRSRRHARRTPGPQCPSRRGRPERHAAARQANTSAMRLSSGPSRISLSST